MVNEPRFIASETAASVGFVHLARECIRSGEDDAHSLHRGSGGSTYTRKASATREAPWRGQGWPTGRPRGMGRASWGGGEVRSTAEADNAGGGKGPQFKTDARRSEGPGDWATYQLRTAFRNCRRRCT